ncbi:tonB-system energizer ExbB [Ciceribacter sp. RN22]|uniref:tonB-system energizer ExbB n=1 Tax=Ciceribacter sp. RN22 TaxID=2954932 RepID=UPI0035AF2807
MALLITCLALWSDGAMTTALAQQQSGPTSTDIVQSLPSPAQPSVEDVTVELPPSALPHNLSPWGMFLAADNVVKAVMISLGFASVVTWTIWLAKTLQLATARYRASRGLRLLSENPTMAGALTALAGRSGTVADMLLAAQREIELSDPAIDHAGSEGLKARVGSALERTEARAGRRMAKGTGVLATIGSTAPFVGLFGTVWGVMNSFIGISQAQTTNLAVVAPGIAEALLATAIGLVAAIPAVVIYNVFARSVTGYRHLLADASAGIERIVSRDLDFRKLSGAGRAKPTFAGE